MQYYIHNLQEGSRPTPIGYSSWIDYWERKTGTKAGNCHKNGCNEPATDGAHDNITPNVPVISLTNVPGVSVTNEPGVSPTNVPQ